MHTSPYAVCALSIIFVLIVPNYVLKADGRYMYLLYCRTHMCTYVACTYVCVHIACTYVRMLSGSQSQYIGTVHTVSGYFERFILQQFPLVTYLATMKGCLPHSSVCSTYKGPSFYIYVHVWHESAILLVKTKYPCIFVPFERMHFYCGNCTSHANSSGLLSLCLSIPDSPHPVSVCGVC